MVPALFVSHGSPMVALDTDEYPQALRAFAQGLEGVKALVVVSAHWETRGGVQVTSSSAPGLIYDFYGFPDPLYALTWPSPGSPQLAREVVQLLRAAGFESSEEPERGLDHGVWVPLRLAMPEAKLPVVQVSLPAGASPQQVVHMGEALRPLRQQGVLLVGSGGVVHNLRRLDFARKHAPVAPWAQEFDSWVAERIGSRDLNGLMDWTRAPNAQLAHPTAEHWLPIFFVLGAALAEDRVTPVFEGFHHSTLSMRSFALRG